MTEEQILQLAENYLTFEKWNDICWKADTLQLLNFARELWAEGFKVGVEYGYDEGWDSSNVSTKMNTWSSDDD